jgi:hypothetical protein
MKRAQINPRMSPRTIRRKLVVAWLRTDAFLFSYWGSGYRAPSRSERRDGAVSLWRWLRAEATRRGLNVTFQCSDTWVTAVFDEPPRDITTITAALACIGEENAP